MLKNLLYCLGLALVLVGLVSYRRALDDATLRSFLREIQYFDQAVSTFKARYQGLPGDLRNTVQYRLSEADTDGNGDGRLTNFADYAQKLAGDQPLRLKAEGELLFFWQHLMNSGLMDKRYGTFPRIGHEQTRLVVFSTSATHHYYQIGLAKINAEDELVMHNAALTPVLAMRLDRKIDDGIYNTGSVQAVGGSLPNDLHNVAVNCVLPSSGYNLYDHNPTCQLRIKANF